MIRHKDNVATVAKRFMVHGANIVKARVLSRRSYGGYRGRAMAFIAAWTVLTMLTGACATSGSSPAVTVERPSVSSLPGITWERDGGELRIEGRVCLEQGVLEYLAVADGGKEYESLFSLKCRPSQLHAAMLIAGYEVGEVAPESRGGFSPQQDPAAKTPPDGAPNVTPPPDEYWEAAPTEPTKITVDIDVQQEDGSYQRFPVEHFLWDRKLGRSPARLTWAFTGSFFHRDATSGREVFVADVERSLIALWYDPTALLNTMEDVGNPYRGDAMGLETHGDNVPARGTAIRLVLRPVD
ncbi:MAG: hypothetical protein IID43_03465 [Planctomycetes bacterium]|nr:hypothetical protein [Planctomycetota bacterium]